MALLQEIREAAVDSRTDIATVLRKCLVLARRLGHEDLRKWAEQELNGYRGRDELPPYRILHVQSRGDFVGPFGAQLKAAPIPTRHLPEGPRKIVTTMQQVDAIAALVSLVTDSNKDLTAPWPPDVTAALAKEFYEDMTCVSAWRVVPRNAIVGVIDTVRNRILSFVLEIERQYPGAGDTADGPQAVPPAERVSQIFNTTIMGSAGIVVGSSHVTQVIYQVQAGNLQSLRNHLAQFGVGKDDLDELEDALGRDQKPADSRHFGARVAAWIGKMTSKAASGAWNVATSGASEFLAAAIKSYYGF